MPENTVQQNEDTQGRLKEFHTVKYRIADLGRRAVLEDILNDMKHKYDFIKAGNFGANNSFYTDSLNDYYEKAIELKKSIILSEESLPVKLIFLFYTAYDNFCESYQEVLKNNIL